MGPAVLNAVVGALLVVIPVRESALATEPQCLEPLHERSPHDR